MPIVQAPYPPGYGAAGATVPSNETVPPAISAQYPAGLFPVGAVVPTRETAPPAITAQYPAGLFPVGFVTPTRETVPPAVSAQYPAGVFPAGTLTPSRETIPPAIGSAALSYSQLVAADGAVAYWRLGEAPGAVVAVDAISGNNGTVTPVVTFGKPGAVSGGNTAAQFDGTAGKIVTAAAVANLNTGFSLEAWVNFPSAAGGSLPILAGDMFLDGGYAWQIRGSNQSTIIFVDATAGTVYGQIQMTLNAWHHVVLTYDGTTVRHYVDAVADATLAMVVNPALGAQPMQIGCDFRQPTFFAGQLDEIAIYRGCLTPAKISAHYAAR